MGIQSQMTARLSRICTDKLQTSPLVREGARHQKKPLISEDNFLGEIEKLVAGSRWWPDTSIDWPTDRQS
jgi:hypothetical protein